MQNKIEDFNNIDVSVITPNFNGSRFIQRLTESVRRQNFNLELIIVDDCSTDDSWEQLQLLAEKFSWIKIARLEINSGPVVARNQAIELAKGRFLAFHDVDDFWLPHKLSTQIKFMLENECTISYSDYRFISEDGRHIGRRLKGLNKIGWHTHHFTRYIGCLTVVLDRKKLPKFKFPQISPAYRAEDFLAWSNCIKESGSLFRCPHDLARYAVVPNSRSSNASRAARSVWELYRRVEKISITLSAIYFFCYAINAIWKRFWYRPRLEIKEVDLDSQWAFLR